MLQMVVLVLLFREGRKYNLQELKVLYFRQYYWRVERIYLNIHVVYGFINI